MGEDDVVVTRKGIMNVSIDKRGKRRALLLFFLLVASGCATGSTGGRRVDLINQGAAVRAVTDLHGGHIDLVRQVVTHDATVLFWWSATCPCVRRYEERMAAIRSDYSPERVAVFAVASNAGEDSDTLAHTARERGFTLPLLRDHGGRLARELGVRTTPTTVVLDREGTVRFKGWIDNERRPGETGRIAYVTPILDWVVGGMKGDTPAADRSPVYGCPITTSIRAKKNQCHEPSEVAPAEPCTHTGR